uniref:Uncharacterized protein n=1 Tax=Sphaerodactylus townsendi TaxID=933632 RepID=A0ACB8EC78_9SAUR
MDDSKVAGGKEKKPGKRGRKPAKIDLKAKLERSRQSARECRARKKLSTNSGALRWTKEKSPLRSKPSSVGRSKANPSKTPPSSPRLPRRTPTAIRGEDGLTLREDHICTSKSQSN